MGMGCGEPCGLRASENSMGFMRFPCFKTRARCLQRFPFALPACPHLPPPSPSPRRQQSSFPLCLPPPDRTTYLYHSRIIPKTHCHLSALVSTALPVAHSSTSPYCLQALLSRSTSTPIAHHVTIKIHRHLSPSPNTHPTTPTASQIGPSIVCHPRPVHARCCPAVASVPPRQPVSRLRPVLSVQCS